MVANGPFVSEADTGASVAVDAAEELASAA
jgi:hypothetical protein